MKIFKILILPFIEIGREKETSQGKHSFLHYAVTIGLFNKRQREKENERFVLSFDSSFFKSETSKSFTLIL